MSAGKDRKGNRDGCGGSRRRKDVGGHTPHPALSPLTMTQADRLVRLAEVAVADRGQPMRYDGTATLIPVATAVARRGGVALRPDDPSGRTADDSG